jgi:hypothetical protein
MNTVNTSEYVDHINHNTLDNRKSNLRICNNSDNSINRKSHQKNNSANCLNVSWNTRLQGWSVKFSKNGKCQFFKYCKSLDEAKTMAEQQRKILRTF